MVHRRNPVTGSLTVPFRPVHLCIFLLRCNKVFVWGEWKMTSRTVGSALSRAKLSSSKVGLNCRACLSLGGEKGSKQGSGLLGDWGLRKVERVAE